MCSQSDIEAGPWTLFKAKRLQELVEFLTLDADNDLLIFRKFKTINLLSLLHQQNRLIELENQISHTNPNDDEKLSLLYEQAARQLQTYNSALMLQSKTMRLPSPASHLTDHLLSLTEEHPSGGDPLKEPPVGLSWFIQEQGIDDLVALVSRPKGFIHQVIDRTSWLKRPFLKSRATPLPHGLEIYSEQRVRRFEKALINLAFCVIVLAPIYVLARVDGVELKFAVIAAAVLVAALLVANGLDEYHRASLGIMVGYTAILVVFLGNTI